MERERKILIILIIAVVLFFVEMIVVVRLYINDKKALILRPEKSLQTIQSQSEKMISNDSSLKIGKKSIGTAARSAGQIDKKETEILMRWIRTNSKDGELDSIETDSLVQQLQKFAELECK